MFEDKNTFQFFPPLNIIWVDGVIHHSLSFVEFVLFPTMMEDGRSRQAKSCVPHIEIRREFSSLYRSLSSSQLFDQVSANFDHDRFRWISSIGRSEWIMGTTRSWFSTLRRWISWRQDLWSHQNHPWVISPIDQKVSSMPRDGVFVQYLSFSSHQFIVDNKTVAALDPQTSDVSASGFNWAKKTNRSAHIEAVPSRICVHLGSKLSQRRVGPFQRVKVKERESALFTLELLLQWFFILCESKDHVRIFVSGRFVQSDCGYPMAPSRRSPSSTISSLLRWQANPSGKQPSMLDMASLWWSRKMLSSLSRSANSLMTS